MERRVILAIILMIGIAVAPTLLWPPKPTAGRPGGPVDSALVASDTTAHPSPAVHPADHAAAQPAEHPSAVASRAPAAPAETVWVTTDQYRLGFSTRGGVLVAAQLTGYKSFAPGDSAHPVQLIPDGRPLLSQRLAVTGDTLTFADLDFTPSAADVRVGAAPATLTFTAERAGATITLTYRFTPGDFRFGVTGAVTGLGPQGAVLMVGLGDGLRSVEADSTDDYRHYAVVTKASKTETKAFASLKADETDVLDGPFEWAGVKSKYFMVAALVLGENQQPFGGAIAVGGPRAGKLATRTALTLTLPVPGSGEFRYDLFAGPLEYRRLAAIGHDLDDANPYGGI
ncbi:MAG TPA: membrane protein insertase YidC, partial [Gemmatimonadales bacterium]